MKNFLAFSPFECFFLPLFPTPPGPETLPDPDNAFPPTPDVDDEITEDVDALIFIFSPVPEEVEEQLEEVLAGLAGREEEVDPPPAVGSRIGATSGVDAGASAPPPSADILTAEWSTES